MNLIPFSEVDGRITDRIIEITGKPVFARVLKLVSHSCDSAVVIPLLILLYFLFPQLRFSLLFPLAYSLGIATAVTVILKFILRRMRPDNGTVGMTRKVDPYSFPSGHAMRSSAIASSVLLSGFTGMGVLLLLWAFIIGTSRIVKGMHFFSDIIGGYLTGFFSALGVIMLHSILITSNV